MYEKSAEVMKKNMVKGDGRNVGKVPGVLAKAKVGRVSGMGKEKVMMVPRKLKRIE